MGEATENIETVETAPKRVLTREDLQPYKDNPRRVIRRKLVDVPEWGEGAQVWMFGVDAKERALCDNYGAPGGKRDQTLFMEAMVACSIRESDADDAKSLFRVPGPDNGKLPAMGWTFLLRLFNEVMELDLGADLGARVVEAMQDFARAEGTPS